MLKFDLYYEDECNPSEYKPIQDAIMAGEDWADICEEFDDWIVTDEATVNLAIKLGWDCDSYIKSDLMELASSYVNYDCGYAESLRRLLVNEALSYVWSYMEEHAPR